MAVRTNLAKNPTFENNVSDETAIENNGGGSASVAQDTGTAQSGTDSLKLTMGANPTQTEEWRVKLRFNNTSHVSLTNGTQYTFSVYAKTSDSRQIKLALEGDVADYYDTGWSTSSSWGRRSFTFTATATDTSPNLVILCNTGSAGDVWVDAILFEQAGSAGDYFDGSLSDTASKDYEWTGSAHNSTSTETDIVSTAKNLLLLGVGS